MTSETLISKVPPSLRRLAEPTYLKGEDIDLIPQQHNLHLTEISMALGINTAALYGKKSAPAKLNSSVSILLRLYAAFGHLLPRIDPPEPEVLYKKICAVEPNFNKYSLGPLLGLETNSSYRIFKEGFEGCAQTTRVLAWLIDKILDENPEQWHLIKEVVEIEAKACAITPVSEVWKDGGWKRSKTGEPVGNKAEKKSSSLKTSVKSAPLPSPTLKKLIRRKPPQ